MILSDIFERGVVQYRDQDALVLDAPGLPREHRTHGQVQEEVYRLANGLRGLGVGTGDHVSALSTNRPEGVVTVWATAALGAVFTPINGEYAKQEIKTIANQADITTLVFDESLFPTVDSLRKESALPKIRHFICKRVSRTFSLKGSDYICYDSLLRSSSPARVYPEGVDSESIAWILFTSGTTGGPKGAMLSHRAVCASAQNLKSLPPQAITVNSRPQSNIAGCMQPIHVMCHGCALWQITVRSEVDYLQCVKRYNVTWMFVPGNVLKVLASITDFSDFDFSSLQFVYYAGLKIPLSYIRNAKAVLGVDLYQGYGLTETAASITTLEAEDHVDANAPDHLVNRMNSCGRAYLSTRIKIFGPDDNELPVGENGEIVIQTDQLFSGYYNNDEQSRKAMKNGWFHSGDVGHVDKDGYVYICDRMKDVIVPNNGWNVYPAEVESVLVRHPAVAEAAVLGIVETVGDEIRAFVTLKQGAQANPDELVAYSKKHLVAYKVPKSVHILPKLPKTLHYQKVAKTELKKWYLEKFAGQGGKSKL